MARTATHSGIAIPPDREAVRDALAAPPRRHRYGPLVGVAAVALGLAWMAVPAQPEQRVTAAVDFDAEIVWGESWRIETRLRPDAPGALAPTLVAWLVFSFEPAIGRLEQAEAAIRAGRPTSVAALADWLGTKQRRDVFRVDGDLERGIAELLDRQLFPTGNARVGRVTWQRMEFK